MPGKSYSWQYVIRDVSPVIEDLIKQHPNFLSLLQLGNALNGPEGVATATKHEWYDHVIGATQGILASEAASGQADVVLATGHGARFAVGDEVAFKGSSYETALVSSIATDTLTMTANLTNTQASATEMVLVARLPVAEGAFASAEKASQGTPFFNYTQTFSRSYEESKQSLGEATEDQQKAKLALHADQKMMEIFRELSNAGLLGRRIGPAAAGTRSRAGGLLWYISQNPDSDYRVNAAGGDLTLKMINDLSQLLGGTGRAVVCHSDMQRQISKINQAAGQNLLVVVNQDSQLGGTRAIRELLTDIPAHGSLVTMLDDNMPKQVVAVCDPTRMYRMPLRGCQLQDVDNSATFNGIRRAITGDYTFEFRNVYETAGYIYNIKAFA